MSTAVSIYSYEDDNGEGLEVWIEDYLAGSVYTSYDCPEDNSVTRLGIEDLITEVAESLGYMVHHHVKEPE